MIRTIQELKEHLFASGLVKNEQEFKGCTPEEIAYIENKYGVLLPTIYKEILALLGHKAG